LNQKEYGIGNKICIQASPEFVKYGIENEVVKEASDHKQGVWKTENPEVQTPPEVRDESPDVSYVLIHLGIVWKILTKVALQGSNSVVKLTLLSFKELIPIFMSVDPILNDLFFPFC
jgi:hypothetical protein